MLSVCPDRPQGVAGRSPRACVVCAGLASCTLNTTRLAIAHMYSAAASKTL